MTDFADEPASSSRVVENETPCRACGYLLRGLPVDGRCPECGLAVEASLQSDFLRFSDRRWLRTIDRGTRCLYWAASMAIVTIAFLFLVVWEGHFFRDSVTGVAVSLPMLLCAAFFVAAACRITARETARIEPMGEASLRLWIRSLSIVWLFNPLVGAGYLLQILRREPSNLMMAAWCGAGLAGSAALYLMLGCTERLAKRIPDYITARELRRCAWILAVGSALLFLLVWLILIGKGVAWVDSFLLVFDLLVLFLVGVALHITLLKFRGRLKEEDYRAKLFLMAQGKPA